MTATIRDVARKANVSVATVSRVLNQSARVSDATREAVLKAQRELNFYLNANARTLAKKDSETVGILVSDISDAYFSAMIKSCDIEAQKVGKSLLITQGFYDEVREQKAIDNLLSHRCSAVIVHALAISDEILSDYMRRIPYMVLVNRLLPEFKDRCVNIDNYGGMYKITEYLISKGHKKFAYINSSHGIVDAKDRLQGFKDACSAHNIKVDDDFVLSVPPSLEGGSDAAKLLLKKGCHNYTALVCYNDAIAAAAMAIFENNKVKIPDEVSITGFDDLFLSSCLNPALTTIKNPIEEMGASALQLSLARYHKDLTYQIPNFSIDLICRNSVKEIE